MPDAIYSSLGVRRVVNACGIYTDLGGSVLCAGGVGGGGGGERDLGRRWTSCWRDRGRGSPRCAGARRRGWCRGRRRGSRCRWARASRAGTGAAMEALPLVDARRADAARARVQVRALRRRWPGARVEWVDDARSRRSRSRPRRGAASGAPRRRGAAARRRVAPLARAAGVPVVVDAAFLSFPVSELARWSRAGDVACFSAKYFCGPNGGRVRGGRVGLVADVAALDFTGYESGRVADVRARVEARPGDGRGHGRGAGGVGGDRSRGAAGAAMRRSPPALAARAAGAAGRAASRCGTFTLDERLVDGPVNAVARARRREPCAARAGRAATRACARWRRRRARVLHRGADGERASTRSARRCPRDLAKLNEGRAFGREWPVRTLVR